MGPKLKHKIENQGVLLLLGLEEERAGTLPRFVGQFTSRLKFKGKGWFFTSFVEQETSPFKSTYLRVSGNCASSLLYLPNFSSASFQQLAKLV
jgi:hypothetical protein